MENTLSNTPAAVVFDMDGLMLETETIYYQAWKDAGIELGYEIDDSLFQEMIGVRTEECDQLLSERLDDAFPMEQFRVLREERWHALADRDGIGLKAGLTVLLDLLDERGIPKAVATSSTRPEAEHSLSVSGLRPRFAVVVSGDEVSNSKPAPDIFLAAAAALDVDPTHCIAFEDSSAGTIAASRAGMQTYIVPDLMQPSAQARACAAGVLTSLHQALAIFENQTNA